MTTTTPVLITVRDALLLMGWIPHANAPVTEALADRMLKLCDARQITTEQFVTRGERWISRPQLEQYIATLQPQNGAA